MKDEIKEILDKLRSDDYYEKEYQKSAYYERDLKKLEDYITNLQEKVENQRQELVSLNDRLKEVKKSNGFLKQENERLKENAIHNDKVVDKAKWNEMIYKSRIEKAIEYINNNSYFKDNVVKTMIFKDYSSNLLNILQGVGKDE